MISLNKIGEIVMEQLKRDKNYTGYLIRLIENEMRSNKFKTKNDLILFINNKIIKDLSTNEVIVYIRNNGLSFNNQEFSLNINRILEEYDKMQQPQNVMPLVNNEEYIPITKVDVNNVAEELILKINFLIGNPRVNVNDFAVNIKSGEFKNINDNQVYIVRKNSNNIFELVNKNMVQDNGKDFSKFTNEELTSMVNNPNVSDNYKKSFTKELEDRKVNNENINKEEVKTRKLELPKMNNAAFASTVLLTAISAISGIVIASVLLAR